MSAPLTVTYWAIRERGLPTYRLELEFSDIPGKTIIHGLTKPRCAEEVESARVIGYEIVSGMRAAFRGFVDI